MKISRVEFSEALRFLIPAMGKSKARPALMNLHAKNENKKLILTTANSFCIKRVALDTTTYGLQEFMIPSTEVLDIWRTCKEHTKRFDPFNVVSLTKNRFVSKNITIKIEKPDFEYPNLEHLFIAESNPVDTFGLSAKVLQLVLESFPNPKSSYAGALKFTTGKCATSHPDTPHFIITQVQTNYRAVIMPVRITDKYYEK